MSDTINISRNNLYLPEDKIHMNRLKYHPINFKYISCSICHFLLPFDTSEACSICGSQYCVSCITIYLTFNERKCANKTCNKIYYPMILLQSKREELEEIEIKCKYEKCPVFKKFRELRLHETQCKYREIICPACSGKFNETDYSNHIQNCSENFLTCQSCGFKAKVKDLINHSCELFLYIRNQIRNEYEKEKENLRREVREEILNDLKPQIEGYIKGVLESERIICNHNGNMNETVTDNLSIKSQSKSKSKCSSSIYERGNISDKHVNILNEEKNKNLAIKNFSTNCDEEIFSNKNKKKNFLKLSKNSNGFLKIKKGRKEEKEKSIFIDLQNAITDRDGVAHKEEIQSFKLKKEENEEIPSNIRRSHRKSFALTSDSKIELVKDLIKFPIEDKITYMKVLLNKSDQVLYGTQQGHIIRFNFEKNKTLKKYSEHKRDVVYITMIDDCKFVSSSKDLLIKIWSLKESNSIMTIDPEGVYPRSILIIPENNEKFLTGDSDGLIRLWSLIDGEFLNNSKDQEKIKLGNYKIDEGVTCLTLLKNNLVLSGEVDGSLSLWNFETMTSEIRFESHSKEVTSIKKFTDDKFFSCSDDGQVRLYSINFDSEIEKSQSKHTFVILYKFYKRVCDIVLLEEKYLYCINNKELNVIEIEKKDVIKRKYLQDKISNLLLIKSEDSEAEVNKFLIYGRGHNYYYTFSMFNKINEN